MTTPEYLRIFRAFVETLPDFRHMLKMEEQSNSRA